jgi:hypothetical protein
MTVDSTGHTLSNKRVHLVSPALTLHLWINKGSFGTHSFAAFQDDAPIRLSRL